jgi:uncharacterized protein involved in cysteine biosynthesis
MSAVILIYSNKVYYSLHRQYAYEFYKQVEKLALGELLCPVSQQLQITFSPWTTMRVYCAFPAMSHKSIITAKLSKIKQKQASF